jgi:hypothetical protein
MMPLAGGAAVPGRPGLSALPAAIVPAQAPEKGGSGMESVTVFVYILIAVLIAPALWFVWFGLDELFRPTRPRLAR